MQRPPQRLDGTLWLLPRPEGALLSVGTFGSNKRHCFYQSELPGMRTGRTEAGEGGGSPSAVDSCHSRVSADLKSGFLHGMLFLPTLLQPCEGTRGWNILEMCRPFPDT